MKLCPNCGAGFVRGDWLCPACGHAPETIEGFVRITGDAEQEASFPQEAHDELDIQQAKSFWFRGRNALIGVLLERYFPAAKSLAEIGCGTGYVLYGLRQRFPTIRLTGGEIFLSGLRHAYKRLGPDVELLQIDARRIPFRDEFDVVAAFDVLEHITDDEAALAAMFEAVKPGGGILLSVPQHPWLWSRADEIGFHKRRYRRGELSAKARRAGFEVQFQTSFFSTLLPAFILQRFLESFHKSPRAGAGLVVSPLLDRVLGALLVMERTLIAAGVRLPAGSSRFLVGRRPTGA